MRKICFFLLLAVVVGACSADGGSYTIDGRLLNLNYGEFYMYSPDGVLEGFDTLTIRAGRFTYKGRCRQRGTVVVVFPNFSEQPFFVGPGQRITVRGDASHMRDITVKGSKDNKLMTTFRKETKDKSDDETRAAVRTLVAEHGDSPVAVYLVKRYFLRCAEPDYKSAAELLGQCLSAQSDNVLLAEDVRRLTQRAVLTVGDTLPAFTTATLSGETLSAAALRKDTAVIYLWASYDFESCNIQRLLQNDSTYHLLGICVDGSRHDCQRVLSRDKITAPIVCDGTAFDGALVQQLGLSTLPDNIILVDGIVVARNVLATEIRDNYSSK